jgi:dipeptidyl aminopeptidase/acylaminoacyl peptidase
LDLFAAGHVTMKMHPAEPLILVNHVDDRGHVRGYEYDMTSGDLVRWVGSEPGSRDLPEPRTVRYPTFDSVGEAPRMIPAFVYPGMGDGPRPVLLDIHGGPEAQARLRFGYESSQRRGITVITPNVRGSTGYGRTYAGLDDWERREDAVRDIGALLDWIARQPDLDENRVAVTGGSYGGYMVLASLVHYAPRLRCGIDVVGLSNFVTFLENTADYRKDVRRAEYGDERIPEMRAFLEEISPLNHAERITSRLMVVQGANDPRVPVGESRQIVERVRANGLDVSYIEASDEGHGFRKPWNALWAGLAQRDFTDQCLLDGA